MSRLSLFIIMTTVLACSNTIGAQNFKYPIPPDSIRDRQGRVEYMVDHFFYEKNSCDTALFQTPKLILDYVYLLKQLNEEKRGKGINALISFVSKSEDVFGLVLYWLDNILYDSASTYYDEGLYLKILESVVISDVDEVMKIMPNERIKILKKNKVGNLANDFPFTDKQGREHRLYEIETPLLLLVFNNPDCINCHRAEEAIINNSIVQKLMKTGCLKIVAIAPDTDVEEWNKHIYPDNWIVGYDKNRIIHSQRLYDIQRFPSMYILDQEKRVKMKEANIERVCNYLNCFLQIR